MSDLTSNQLERMINQALEKEQNLWKPLELSTKDTRSGSLVTYEHRADIIEWISLVAMKFQFYPEAPSLALSILDKFLSCVKVQTKYLKCIALTCLHVASKMTEEDEMVPHIANLLTQSSANCTVYDLVRMERLILTKLEWNVNMATPLHFLQVCQASLLAENADLLSSVSHMTKDIQLDILTYKLQLCMMSRESCQWSPSMFAVSLLSLELEQFRPDWFPLTVSLLKLIKKVNFPDLIACRESISFYLALVAQSTNAQVETSRQHKRTRHHTDVSRKRKMTSPPPDQEDDIYASIKGLYSEEGPMEAVESSGLVAKLSNEE